MSDQTLTWINLALSLLGAIGGSAGFVSWLQWRSEKRSRAEDIAKDRKIQSLLGRLRDLRDVNAIKVEDQDIPTIHWAIKQGYPLRLENTGAKALVRLALAGEGDSDPNIP